MLLLRSLVHPANVATSYRAVFVSFGGLLLYLEGPYKKLAPLRIDHLYLLLKK
jgi:hypothetical protein